MPVVTGLAVFSAGVSFLGSRSASKSKKREAARRLAAGKEQNAYNKIAAIATRASGQMASRNEERRGEIIASRAVAVAAAGGYSSDVDGLISDIDGEATYRASIAMFESSREAARLEFEGEQAEKYGIAQAGALNTQAKATTLSSFGDLFSAGAGLYQYRETGKFPT